MMDVIGFAQQVILQEAEALQVMARRLDLSFTRTVEALQKVLENQRKIVVVGVGKSGNIGHKIAATLNSTGATAVVLNSQNALPR